MLQKLNARNILDANHNPAGGSVRGVGIAIDWQDGPMRETEEEEGAIRRDREHAKSDMKSLCEMHPFETTPSGYMRIPEREDVKHNGAFVEGVIKAAALRLEFYQGSKFACEENAAALNHLNQAIVILEARTARRQAAGTEGTHTGN